MFIDHQATTNEKTIQIVCPTARPGIFEHSIVADADLMSVVTYTVKA